MESIEEFKLSTAELVDDAYVVTLGGEADIYGAPQLEQELDRLRGDGAREVIVDLLEVTFIDSTVLGVLLKATRRAQADGADVVLVTDDPRVLRAFELTGLLDHFRFERSLASAVERSVERTFAG